MVFYQFLFIFIAFFQVDFLLFFLVKVRLRDVLAFMKAAFYVCRLLISLVFQKKMQTWEAWTRDAEPHVLVHDQVRDGGLPEVETLRVERLGGLEELVDDEQWSGVGHL